MWDKYKWVMLVAALLLVALGKSCYDLGVSHEETKAAKQTLADANDTINDLRGKIVHDTVMISHTIHQIDTLWRVRTERLTAIEAVEKVADGLIALVPASDTVCHKAFDSLHTACELLHQQVHDDSVVIQSSDSTLKEQQKTHTRSLETITGLETRLKSIKIPGDCKIAFMACPSRGESFAAGGIIVLILRVTGVIH